MEIGIEMENLEKKEYRVIVSISHLNFHTGEIFLQIIYFWIMTDSLFIDVYRLIEINLNIFIFFFFLFRDKMKGIIFHRIKSNKFINFRLNEHGKY